MLKNFMKTAIRSLVRHRNYTLINITGLTLGIPGALIIFLVLQHELGFDRHQQNYHKAWRVVTHYQDGDGTGYQVGVPVPFYEAFKTDFPEVAHFVQLVEHNNLFVVSYRDPGSGTDRSIEQEDNELAWTVPGYFNMLDYEVLYGDPQAALKSPASLVISEKAATRLFGNAAAANGQVIQIDGEQEFTVAAVVRPVNEKTDFPFQYFAPYESYPVEESMKEWGSTWSQHQAWMVLQDAAQAQDIEQRLVAFREKHIENNDLGEQFFLQPLSELHYDNRYGIYTGRQFSKANAWSLAAVAIILLVTVCINFVNMATAMAIKRSRETGIRKVLGSRRSTLMVQYLSETFMITCLSTTLALVVTSLALGHINEFLGQQLTLSVWQNPWLLVFVPALVVFITLAAGAYPAFVVSGYSPVKAIKSQITSSTAGKMPLRKTLVTLQFFIAQLLLIGTIVINMQMAYFKNGPLGFDKEATVVLDLPDAHDQHITTMRDQLARLAGTQRASMASETPISQNTWRSSYQFAKDSGQVTLFAQLLFADTAYLPLYGMELVAGRNFHHSDTLNEVVINESMAKDMGFQQPGEALGQTISMGSFDVNIAGVVKDFKVHSFHSEIKPTLIGANPLFYFKINLKMTLASFNSHRPQLEGIWKEHYPNHNFKYRFLDEKIAAFYSKEEKLSQLLTAFCLLTIVVGCLGLYGLVSFFATAKTREIGIRKVLGASLPDVLMMFGREFTLLVFYGFILAAPVGYWLMGKWLEGFAYRIDVGAQTFVLAIVVSVVIAWASVGYRSWLAASANPVKSLRSD